MRAWNDGWAAQRLAQRLPRFLAVGAVGTLVDFALFVSLQTWVGVPTLAANTFSYSVGIVNNFVWHRRWTWAHARKTLGAQFAQFVVISLSALALNNVLVLWLAPVSGAAVAKILATGIGVGWNFFANHFWTFRADAV